MKSGFLSLITHPEHPGMVRACMQDKPPPIGPAKDGGQIRYVARFEDIEAAMMHIQNAMHTTLVDLENRIYRKPLVEMIACVEADALEHSRVWVDPAIPADELTQIDALIKQRQTTRRRIDRIWQIVGFLGLLLLLLFSLRL